MGSGVGKAFRTTLTSSRDLFAAAGRPPVRVHRIQSAPPAPDPDSLDGTLRALFHAPGFDPGRRGWVEIAKFRELLNKTIAELRLDSIAPTEDDVLKLLRAADADGNGQLEWHEYRGFVVLLRNIDQGMRKARSPPAASGSHLFADFDDDGSGTVELSEISKLVNVVLIKYLYKHRGKDYPYEYIRSFMDDEQKMTFQAFTIFMKDLRNVNMFTRDSFAEYVDRSRGTGDPDPLASSQPLPADLLPSLVTRCCAHFAYQLPSGDVMQRFAARRNGMVSYEDFLALLQESRAAQLCLARLQREAKATGLPWNVVKHRWLEEMAEYPAVFNNEVRSAVLALPEDAAGLDDSGILKRIGREKAVARRPAGDCKTSGQRTRPTTTSGKSALPPEVDRAMRQLFHAPGFDPKHRGWVAIDRFRDLLTLTIAELQARERLSSIDADGNGRLEWDEYRDFVVLLRGIDQGMRKLFADFDIDGSGTVELSEISQLVSVVLTKFLYKHRGRDYPYIPPTMEWVKSYVGSEQKLTFEAFTLFMRDLRNLNMFTRDAFADAVDRHAGAAAADPVASARLLPAERLGSLSALCCRHFGFPAPSAAVLERFAARQAATCSSGAVDYSEFFRLFQECRAVQLCFARTAGEGRAAGFPWPMVRQLFAEEVSQYETVRSSEVMQAIAALPESAAHTSPADLFRLIGVSE
eukprot:m51a1_g4846 hypothetical protein (693) ;mRNA; r:246173-249331